MIVPYQGLRRADGYMMVAAGNDNLFRRLCAVLDRAGLRRGSALSRQQRPRRPPRELVPILADIFATKKRSEWAEAFGGGGIPNGPINTLDQVIDDAQTEALGIIQRKAGGETWARWPAALVRRHPPPFAKPRRRSAKDNKVQAR